MAGARLWEASALILVALIASFGCQSGQDRRRSIEEYRDVPSKPEYGGTLFRVLRGDPVSLQPLYGYSDGAACQVIIHLFPPLFRPQEDPENPGKGKLTPVLAESYRFSPDHRVLTITLRDSVFWEDGHPVTTEDVEFTYRKAIDPHTKTIVHYAFSQIESLEVVDRRTFRVYYKRPFVYALNRWDIGVLPKHILEGKDINTDEFNRRPVGYGAFKFKEWVPGDRVVIEANPRSFLGRPYLDRMVFRIIPEAAVQLLELEAGNIDLVYPITPTQYARELADSTRFPHVKRFRFPNTLDVELVFNLLRPRFQDKRIRQAFWYAINRQELIDGVLYGLGRICHGPIPPESWAYNPNIKKYEYNPDRARELLAEAGWVDRDGDGIVDKDGVPFEFTLLCSQSEVYQQVATVVQQYLARIGVRMKIKVLEWSVYLNNFIAKRDFDMCVSGGGLGVLDPDLTFEFHSSQIHDTEYNWATYINPRVDSLIELSTSTFDLEMRRKALWEAQQIIVEDAPRIYLFLYDSLGAYHRRVQGVRPYPPPLGFDYNMDWWWIPKKFQRKYWGP